MTDTIMVQSANLLCAAKEIFGEDLVVNAWVVGDIYDDMGGSNRENVIKYTRKTSYDNFLYGNRLDINDILVIEFCNGNRLKFSASEWAEIEKINDDEDDVEIV
jgi:hypothetical protein